MKKFVIVVVLIFVYFYSFADWEKDFEFYKSIPKYESISLSGQDISIVIKKYSVTLSATDNSSDYKKSLTGSGLVSWDPDSKCMYLTVTGKISGSYSWDEDVYITEKKYNVGSTTLQILFGNDAADNYRYEKRYDHTNYYRASGTSDFSFKMPLHISSDGKYYSIQDKTLSATLTGNCTRTISFYLSSGNKYINYGAIKSTASSTDEFGTWDWNKERTKIWLYSTNMSNDRIVIFINSNNSSKPFQMVFNSNGNKIDGISSSESEDGKRLIQFSVSFEDGTNVTLPFVERLQDNGFYVYDYATYNRFLNEWNYNAASIIGQLKDKQTMVLTYKYNNSNYSAILELEGLENILSYF